MIDYTWVDRMVNEAEQDRRAAALQLRYKMELNALTAKNLKEIKVSDWPEWMKEAAAAAIESRHAFLMKKCS
jgi:hypothetical protein